MSMTGAQLRSAFLGYFGKNGHKILPGASLVPGNDPTLLFTNAGMVQFKEFFLGFAPADWKRAATAQRCLRVSGKHNDLENVGYTARHHTLFEMLGNFPFGDYFKKEAIFFGWDFLTREMGLSGERMTVSVFRDDDEAYDLWHGSMGLPTSRIVRFDEKDNFWGMGLERLAAVVQGVKSNYDTDLFRGIIAEIGRLSGVAYGRSPLQDAATRVIADHARATAFLIADGILPANEGRGDVLRRIMRRALRHGNKLGPER